MYDLIIVGAGPAGATLAKLLAPRFNILLLDSRKAEGCDLKTTHKCCGGLLAPDAQHMLSKLGLGVPKDILVDPQLFSVRVMDLTNNLERDFQRFYFNMNRDLFDQWLIQMIPSQVTKVFNAYFKSCCPIPSGHEVTYWNRDSGREEKAQCRLLVGADGGQSKVRAYVDATSAKSQYIAIQQWFKTPKQMPYYTAIFDETITDFYGWTIPKDDYLILGVALKPIETPRARYELLRKKLIQRGFPLEHPMHTEGAFIRRPQSRKDFCAGKNGIALIGEAAGAISPSSAEGISYALMSASLLAESLNAGNFDCIDSCIENYSKKCNAIRLNLTLKHLKSPAMYNSFARKIALTGLNKFL